MQSGWLVVLIVAGYIALLALISFLTGRSTRTASGFTSGGKSFPAVLIGFLLASEFIGTSASIGTAQEAYESGISAAWNIVSLGIGFVLFASLLARKFSELGENTISGALDRYYGRRVRTATSMIMVCSLLIVAVSVYASGGAILSGLLGVDHDLTVLLVGVLATLYVVVGGMRSVVYTNVVHAIVKMAGVVILAIIGAQRAGGVDGLRAALPPTMFSWHGVGFGQIFAWLIAGVGAIFATQYVVQAITTAGSAHRAQRAGFYSALILVPYGLLAAFIGMCSAVVYPHLKSIQAMPAFAMDIDPVLAGIVVAGLAGAMFGTIAALVIGASTLLLKDFYQPHFNAAGDDRRDVLFLRAATVVTGLVPIALALFATDVLTVTFLAKSLRAALAVLVLLMFYAPRYGTRSGAFWAIVLALPTTIGWFLLGDPFGIDNAYIAVATPLLVMTCTHLTSGRSKTVPAVTGEKR
ncbi:solute:Na+ symporter, SSS family [Saccharopolyspora flava]|uniref:Solute:Na+ symporter, SSS family n=1 Tax=Saccharopolyspora flava TaxID=95161 RepID=A0A1I6UEG8_9PSEU|nr:solute:Na+ symporter, SSS family [Saccharopolyspora flava]